MEGWNVAQLAIGALLGVQTLYLRRLVLVIDRIDGEVRAMDRRLSHVEALVERGRGATHGH